MPCPQPLPQPQRRHSNPTQVSWVLLLWYTEIAFKPLCCLRVRFAQSLSLSLLQPTSFSYIPVPYLSHFKFLFSSFLIPSLSLLFLSSILPPSKDVSWRTWSAHTAQWIISSSKKALHSAESTQAQRCAATERGTCCYHHQHSFYLFMCDWPLMNTMVLWVRFQNRLLTPLR